jgi:hypothetical protein
MHPRLRFAALFGPALLLHLGLGAPAIGAPKYRVTVPPAAEGRAALVVRFSLPPDAPRALRLRDAQARVVPLQIAADRTACFVVPEQKPGEALAYTLDGEAASVPDRIVVVRQPNAVEISVDGRASLAFRTDPDDLPRAGIPEKFKRAGYLHPVFSPAGTVVTGDYPSNHVHHHGIWTSWSRVEFQGRKPNFWEMAEQTGTVELVAVDRMWNGPVHGGFASRQRMVDLSTPARAPVLNETWELTVFAVEPAALPVRMFDLAVTQTNATADAVKLPVYRYGGVGFRGPDGWDGKNNLRVLTSGGATTREEADAKPARWCYLGGASGAGVVILSAPENVHAPQAIRVHPVMPFFSFAATAQGEIAITPERPYRARYRFIVSDTPPSMAQIEAWWSAYAQPPVATVQSL